MAPSFDNETSLINFDVRDGNGVKGTVDLGISKVPQAYIQPPAEQINKKHASKCPDHDEVVNQIVRAVETLGFFQVVNHGVPIELLDSLKQTAHNFFGLPPERKSVYRKEVSPSPLVKDVALQYLKTSHEMVRKLLEALLGNLGAELDDSKIDGFIGKKMVNMNFYLTCPNPELTISVRHHSNMDTLTILLQDGIGGLYIKVPQDVNMEKKGEWVEIPPISGALIINISDMLQIWSNGRYKSAEHIVHTTSTKSRVSIPIFTTHNQHKRLHHYPKWWRKMEQLVIKNFCFQIT
ncbi:hypothetical protein ES319_1Z078700v1 [Gossypium barbadense]|uniref:Fe2OG dioxygenase domain-containing protein n=1 Tax=Gossypium barbadense TaxID=3634 RepID=A0A5J5NDJ3_GOSBA|nr:hypothetical protein ES319_1Z078700v1 [Gossypium barbadense]